MKLNKYIKDYRKLHNLTLQDFAEAAGLSKAYVSILEKEVRPQNNKKIVPSIETIQKIAFATGKTLNELILLLNADEQIVVNDDLEDIELSPKTNKKSKDEEADESIFIDVADMNKELIKKHKILFSKTKNATLNEMNKIIAMVDVLMGENNGD